jgi:predicted metalloprotease with PDZ domain
MKKIFLAFALSVLFFNCKSVKKFSVEPQKSIAVEKHINNVKVAIDLINVIDDKVLVTVTPPMISTDEVAYSFPKIVPGTYSEDDYGKFIEDFKAYDTKGNLLVSTKKGDNAWVISNAKTATKITYLVNDTFDVESTHKIFSPVGSNISPDNYLINTHCFVGNFSGNLETPYVLNISHSEIMFGSTSMIDSDISKSKDVFETSRYAELVENPIMYCKPNNMNFSINGMDILISVYSPNSKITAEMVSPKMKDFMIAQKTFLGNFNSTKKYSVLIYLSDALKKPDARGAGALEHPTATTVVLPESMGVERLSEALKDVVSHEFFHIVTPLTIHSQEIQNFDYNTPKMSEHLWMYEGVTEYFANLFQINQGLISEDDFYNRMAEKINNSYTLNDTMSFTKMSANVLVEPYKSQYENVYEKGALIGMCLDLIIREKSKGERGILDLMKKLSIEFGTKKAFNDADLFAKITELTYPEVGDFLINHVAGTTPIAYEEYFKKVGVTKVLAKKALNPFLIGKKPKILKNKENNEFSIVSETDLPIFFTSLGLKVGDIFVSINDKAFNREAIIEYFLTDGYWKDGDSISLKIKRDGQEKVIKGKVNLTFEDSNDYQSTDVTKTKLKDAWLKG